MTNVNGLSDCIRVHENYFEGRSGGYETNIDFMLCGQDRKLFETSVADVFRKYEKKYTEDDMYNEIENLRNDLSDVIRTYREKDNLNKLPEIDIESIAAGYVISVKAKSDYDFIDCEFKYDYDDKKGGIRCKID